jgi:hypothetical protein
MSKRQVFAMFYRESKERTELNIDVATSLAIFA